MKLAFENCYFTMLKWLNFDDRFESQIFQGNFDPLKPIIALKTIRGHLNISKTTPKIKRSNFWPIFSEGLLPNVLVKYLQRNNLRMKI